MLVVEAGLLRGIAQQEYGRSGWGSIAKSLVVDVKIVVRDALARIPDTLRIQLAHRRRRVLATGGRALDMGANGHRGNKCLVALSAQTPTLVGTLRLGKPRNAGVGPFDDSTMWAQCWCDDNVLRRDAFATMVEA